MQDYLGHFDKFLESNCDAMIVYGTDIHNKITILSDFIFKHYHNTGTTFLIRTNHLGNIDFWSTPIELDKRKRRVSERSMKQMEIIFILIVFPINQHGIKYMIK